MDMDLVNTMMKKNRKMKKKWYLVKRQEGKYDENIGEKNGEKFDIG